MAMAAMHRRAQARKRSTFVSWTMRLFAISSIVSRRVTQRWVVSARDLSSSASYKTVRVHVVHRHGDRTPITPLLDEDFWRTTLVPKDIAAKISEHTKIIEATESNTHTASGRGPFGKLTELGLLQMISLGTTLRERFASQQRHSRLDGTTICIEPLGTIETEDIHVFCTDFERTIQSVQGLLVGLMDGKPSGVLSITLTTNWMIPDAQPRRTMEQTQLERILSSRPHILEREQELRPLAIRTTQALSQLLASDAHTISFGVDDEEAGQMEVELQPLGWNQLAEITKCLAVRDLLPDAITLEDQEAISKHAAWRWFENFTNRRLVFLSMNEMARTMTEALAKEESKLLTIWSAHDSTLIGLLCAFRLQKPTTWPEYASSILMELIEANDDEDTEYYVRFSLNGEQLNMEWEHEPVMDMVPMSLLLEKMQTETVAETII
jgi:acid phosphatase